MICRYCDNEAQFVDNALIYGKRYGNSFMAWWCKNCDASIGVHQNDPEKPLGNNLANRRLRRMKMKVKELFIERFLGSWDCSQKIKTRGYRQLAKGIGIKLEDCHFGNFEIEDLEKALAFLILKK